MLAKRNLKPNEIAIRNCIIDFLRYKKNFFVGPITLWEFMIKKEKIFKILSKHHMVGASDILGILNDGKFLAIEVKRNASHLATTTQRVFIQQINISGGLAFVAYDVETVEKKLKDYI